MKQTTKDKIDTACNKLNARYFLGNGIAFTWIYNRNQTIRPYKLIIYNAPKRQHFSAFEVGSEKLFFALAEAIIQQNMNGFFDFAKAHYRLKDLKHLIKYDDFIFFMFLVPREEVSHEV